MFLTHAVNLGKGRALKTAFNEVFKQIPGGDRAITADSDGQHTPACIQKCMEAMEKEAGKADFGLPEFRSGQRPGKIGMGQQNHTSGAQIPLRRGGIGYQTGLRGIPAAFMRHLMNVKGERFEFETYMLLEAGEQRSASAKCQLKRFT